MKSLLADYIDQHSPNQKPPRKLKEKNRFEWNSLFSQRKRLPLHKKSKYRWEEIVNGAQMNLSKPPEAILRGLKGKKPLGWKIHRFWRENTP